MAVTRSITNKPLSIQKSHNSLYMNLLATQNVQHQLTFSLKKTSTISIPNKLQTKLNHSSRLLISSLSGQGLFHIPFGTSIGKAKTRATEDIGSMASACMSFQACSPLCLGLILSDVNFRKKRVICFMFTQKLN